METNQDAKQAQSDARALSPGEVLTWLSSHEIRIRVRCVWCHNV